MADAKAPNPRLKLQSSDGANPHVASLVLGNATALWTSLTRCWSAPWLTLLQRASSYRFPFAWRLSHKPKVRP